MKYRVSTVSEVKSKIAFWAIMLAAFVVVHMLGAFVYVFIKALS